MSSTDQFGCYQEVLFNVFLSLVWIILNFKLTSSASMHDIPTAVLSQVRDSQGGRMEKSSEKIKYGFFINLNHIRINGPSICLH